MLPTIKFGLNTGIKTKSLLTSLQKVSSLFPVQNNNSNNNCNVLNQPSIRLISSTPNCLASFEFATGPKRWPRYNKKVFPPQEPQEERRPAYVCHMNLNFKYSPDNLWYVACLIRGMSIDEALRQIEYVKRKGVWIVKKTLLEAQDLAVKNHHVEFKSNLWVAESFVGKGLVIKGIRRHARMRMGEVRYKYAHYFVRLEEGSPPDNIYPHQPKFDGPSLLQEYIDERRRQRIYLSY